MIKSNSKFKNLNSGFTLLEALVAVSILMVAVVAPMTVAQKGLSSATYSKSQMIASYLAQDAIEYIKNVRDQVSIRNSFDWNGLWGAGGFFELCQSPYLCKIDTNASGGAGLVQAYNNGDILSKDANGFYGFTGTLTIFSRKIQVALSDDLDSNGNKYKALVTVTVGWGTDQVEVKTLIFNY